MSINDFQINGAPINGSGEIPGLSYDFDVLEGISALAQHYNAFSGAYGGAYSESFDMDESLATVRSLTTTEIASVIESISTGGTFIFSVVAGLGITGKHDLAFIAKFAELIDAADDAALTRESVLSFIESLVTTGNADTLLHGMCALSEAIAVTEQLSPGIGAKFLEAVLRVNDGSTLAMSAIFPETIGASSQFAAAFRGYISSSESIALEGLSNNAFEVDVSEAANFDTDSVVSIAASFVESLLATGNATDSARNSMQIAELLEIADSANLSFSANFAAAFEIEADTVQGINAAFIELFSTDGALNTAALGNMSISESLAVVALMRYSIGADFSADVGVSPALIMGVFAQFVESLQTSAESNILLRASMPLSESLALTAIHNTGLDAVFAEALGVDADSYAGFVVAFAESINSIADLGSMSRATFSLIESLRAVDFPGLGFSANFDASMGIDADSILGIVASFVESMKPVDQTDFLLHANLPISEAVALTALHKVGFDAVITESVIIRDNFVFDSKLILAILESMVFGDTPEMSARILFPVSEILNETAEVSSQAALRMALAEGIEFGGVLNTPEGTFDAWVVNAETKAPWQYNNFPFNSFTYANGKYLALSDVGLYELSGDTDDGAQIDAVLKTGLMDFGTALQKSVPMAYFGYSSDGRLLFKTITTATGQKIERWYELKARTADDTTEARVKMARGVKSTYWQFEIANIDGADFDIDSVKLLPAILKRRI